MTGAEYAGPYLVVQEVSPLRIPLAIHGSQRLLLHATPRDKFTRFDSVEDAEHAIERTISLARQLWKFEWSRTQYQIVPVRAWLDNLEAQTTRHRRSLKPEEET